MDKPTDVESFVNMYKATYGQDEKFEQMEVVTGEKILIFITVQDMRMMKKVVLLVLVCLVLMKIILIFMQIILT